jgi:translocation and assembly module TamB
MVTFSSSPPLDAKQVLLMVTAGELPHDEIVYGGTQRVAQLGAFLGLSLINTFGGDATEADRLSFSTGERVSRQGRETYNIEYRLTERMTVVGEYDEFDGYNAGMKWRITAPEKMPPKNSETAARRPAETKEAVDGSAR